MRGNSPRMGVTFRAVFGGDELLSFEASLEFVEWLQEQTSNGYVGRIDPYGDTALDPNGVRSLLNVLGDVLGRKKVELTAKYSSHQQRLPKDPALRQHVLSLLLEKELRADKMGAELLQAIAVLEAAEQSGAVVELLGD